MRYCGSGSVVSAWSGSSGSRFGSGYFYNQAKTVKKNFNSYCFVTSEWLFFFEKNDVNLMLPSWRSPTKIAGSGSESVSQRYGSSDPDPHQNFTDPQHCKYVLMSLKNVKKNFDGFKRKYGYVPGGNKTGNAQSHSRREAQAFNFHYFPSAIVSL